MVIGTNAAIVISGIVVALGVYLAVSTAGSDTAVFGWFLAAVGALSALVNFLLRGRV